MRVCNTAAELDILPARHTHGGSESALFLLLFAMEVVLRPIGPVFSLLVQAKNCANRFWHLLVESTRGAGSPIALGAAVSYGDRGGCFMAWPFAPSLQPWR